MTELLAVSRAEPLLDLIQRFVVVVEEPIRLNPLQWAALVSETVDADTAPDRYVLKA